MRAIYKITDTISLGLHSLAVHKVRSALTALGIIFGVCGVIAMLAINQGFAHEAQKVLRELGSDNIIINSEKPPSGGSGASAQHPWGAMCYGVTRRDVTRLRSNVPGMVRCVTVHRTLKYARIADRSLPVAVLATEPEYTRVARTVLLAGRNISHVDILRAAAHCVLTKLLADRLFTYEDPLGQTVHLGGEPFVVVGILDRVPTALAGGAGSSDLCALIPITTDLERFGEYTFMVSQGTRTLEKVEVSQVILQMQDEKAVVAGAPIARSLLDRHHDEGDYRVKIPLELLEQQAKQRRLWNIMFLSIASISLVVGGIGIMNIMLASITERTREIGIRRALGAKRHDIIVQFLVEAITLTAAGGLVGVAIGWAVPYGVEKALMLKTQVTAMTMILPLVMAIVVGLVSGLYPAYRAAKLDPIEALRHE